MELQHETAGGNRARTRSEESTGKLLVEDACMFLISDGYSFADAKALFTKSYCATAVSLSNGRKGEAAKLIQTHRNMVSRNTPRRNRGQFMEGWE